MVVYWLIVSIYNTNVSVACVITVSMVDGRWSMLVVAGSLIFSAFRRAGATGLRCEQPDSFVLGS